MMQTSAALKTIKKKLVRKVLDLIKKWSDDELKCRKSEKGEEGECLRVCMRVCAFFPKNMMWMNSLYPVY